MPSSWFFAPYVTVTSGHLPARQCAIQDYNDQIVADGGAWSDGEVLGNQAIVKVTASAATLNAIAGDTRCQRIPRATTLDSLISDLTAAQQNALRAKVLSLGYTAQELTDAIPNLANATLRDVLRFVATRRIAPRWDETQGWVFDGRVFPGKRPDDIDVEARQA